MLVKSRLLRWLIRVTVGFLLLSALVLSVAIFTPVPDRLMWSTLEKAVSKAGGTVSARREGALISGLDLWEFHLRIPGNLTLRAKRIHMRLSPWALVIGVVRLKDVRVESPRLELVPAPPATGAKPFRNPGWLRLLVPNFKVLDGSAVIRPQPPGRGALAFGDIRVSGNLTVQGQRIHITLAELSSRCPVPAPGEVTVRGFAVTELGRSVSGDLRVKAGSSKVQVKGRMRLRDDAVVDYRAELLLKGVSLTELFPGGGAPDLVLEGPLALEGNPSGLSWEGETTARGYGGAKSRGEMRWGEGGFSITSEASTEGFNLTPIWNPTPDKRIWCRGQGNWSLTARPGEPVRWEASARARDAVFMDVPVQEASLVSRGEGPRATITGPFVTPISGPGTLAVAWDADTWSVDVTGSSAGLPEALSNWGIHILSPPPKPLHAPKGRWEARKVRISGDDEAFAIAAEGRDPCGGEVTFRSAPYPGHGPVSWEVTATGMNPSEWGIGPEGSIGGRVRFEGADWDRGLLTFEMAAGSWGDVRHEPFSARLHFTPDLLTLEPCSIGTSAGQARGHGSLHLAGETLDGHLDVVAKDLADLRPFTGRADLGGSLEGAVALSGPLSNLSVRGDARVRRFTYENAKVDSATLEGSADLAAKSADLRLSWKGLEMGEVRYGDGTLSLKGASPKTRLRLDAAAGEGRRLSVDALGTAGDDGADLVLTGGRVEAEGRVFRQEGEARLIWTPAFLSLRSLSLTKGEALLALDLRLGLDSGDPPIEGRLGARHIPLKLIPMPPSAGVFGGTIEADLAWTGTRNHPSLSGTASLVEGSYRYPKSDLAITPIVLKLKAKGDRLVVTEATGTTAEGGKASGSGAVLFSGFLPEAFDLKVVGRDFPFILGRDVQGRCDFEAAFTGSPTHPVLDGTARVLKGKIQLPETVGQAPLPTSIKFVGGAEIPRPGEASAASGPSRLGGRVRLESDGGLWVSNRSLLAELAGGLNIAFTPEGPTVGGRLEVLQGRYLFRGRKFDLSDSRLLFRGTTDLTPQIDIRALYRAGDVEITVHLTGNPSKPDLGLSSSPPMPREDLLSLLLFGTTSSELTNLQRQTSRNSAAALAQQFGTIPVAGVLGDTLGLDAVEVGAAYGGTTVGFSKYVGDRLVVEYRQVFGTLPEQRLNLRYRINRRWSFETQISNAGKSGADILWEKRY